MKVYVLMQRTYEGSGCAVLEVYLHREDAETDQERLHAQSLPPGAGTGIFPDGDVVERPSYEVTEVEVAPNALLSHFGGRERVRW